MYRLTGWALVALGVVCATLAATLGWGLMAVLAVVCLVAGAVVLADRPAPLPRTYGDELREQRYGLPVVETDELPPGMVVVAGADDTFAVAVHRIEGDC